MELEILIEVRRGEARIARERASTATAVEDARFRSVRAGHIPNDGASPPVSIEPQLADGNGGEVEALELRVAGGAGVG